MKRQIKFRAWMLVDIDLFGDDGSAKDVYEMVYDLAFEEYEPLNEHLKKINTLMQNIGIKDRHGIDIYDGDIVMYKNPVESGTAKIEWWPGGFVFVWIEQQTSSPSILTPAFYLACADELEVIGNIYETPELECTH